MRRSLFPVTTAGAALLLLSVVSASDARAQDLTPPPPMDPAAPGAPSADPNAPATAPTAEQATTEKLDEAEHEDSGRNFELIWVDAHLGASYIDMRQFSSDTLALEKASAGGPMFALGAGVRFVLLVLGVRAKYNALSAFNMWQLNAEIGLKVPISKLDLLIGAHGGYSFVGSVGEGTAATNSGNTPTNNDAVKIRGFNAGLDFALDYYVTPTFSVGGGVFGDFLYLKRPPVDPPSGLTAEQAALVASDPLYQKSGTTAGMQLGGALRLGFHFGL
jgi:hypothetical protein